jgi:putative addiction module component (TIGR02574 family)
MSIHIEKFGIDQLSVPERLELIEQIWDSLPEEVRADEIPAWHLAELARRRATADAAPAAGKPWREALARFGARHEPAGHPPTGGRGGHPDDSLKR